MNRGPCVITQIKIDPNTGVAKTHTWRWMEEIQAYEVTVTPTHPSQVRPTRQPLTWCVPMGFGFKGCRIFVKDGRTQAKAI